MQRFVLPLGLLFIGVYVLVGCIYIPTFNATTGAKDARNYVGAANEATKPLKLGMSTRANVHKVLGKPFFRTTDGRFVVYSWKKQKGLLVYPQCFSALPEARAFAMTLEFDSEGVLRSFDVESQQGYAYIGSPPNAKQFTPYRVTIYQMELNLQDQPEKLAQLRAATRAARPTTGAGPRLGNAP